MGTKRKSSGCGAITARSLGDGSIVESTNDLPPKVARAQRRRVLYEQPILETAEHADLRLILDGEAERGLFGFNASTENRVLLVPYTRTTDAAEAIVLCRRDGLVFKKLAQMGELAASIAYFTAIIPPPSPS